MATDLDRAEHIIEAIDRISAFLKGVDENKFLNDEVLMYACYANVIIVGEAATKMSKETKKKVNKVEWQLIAGFRNIIVHEYFRINWRLIWDVISTDLPTLKNELVRNFG